MWQHDGNQRQSSGAHQAVLGPPGSGGGVPGVSFPSLCAGHHVGPVLREPQWELEHRAGPLG